MGIIKKHDLKHGKIAILGFGREGASTLRFLKKDPEYRNAKITILDKKLDPRYLKNLASFDLIIKTPGISFNLPEIKQALRHDVHFSSVTDLFFKKIAIGNKGIVIGITGTKGKGTTSTLIYKILRAAGKDAYLAGNIGKPAIDILPKLNKNSITVLELSSFQLHNLKHSPYIAVALGIFPDHMDSHKSFGEYVRAKANIAKWQKKNDTVFYAASNKYSAFIARTGPAKKYKISTATLSALKNLKLKIPGPHNLKNAAMAFAVTRALGINTKTIRKVLENFTGLEHRIELARTLHKISFYNDSGSTNPETTAAAVKSFRDPIILIAGGKDKNLDYKPLLLSLKKSSVKQIVLLGENKKKIWRAIKSSMIPITFAKTLKNAVHLAMLGAKSYRVKNSGVIILFSPGSASFDMFKNYKERGEQFKQLVGELH